ncbi:MAG: prepilin-type N-terminal cleavage/methylation domain-containing protein [Acidobacteriota bacterium]|nr:prepilin-type N-terminal cleavage/methylation domain-containing protein [Acidobacteriota bacterium]
MPAPRLPSPFRGSTLIEALVALALTGLLAAGVLSLFHTAVHHLRAADRLDRARGAAETIAARLDGVSFHRLPGYFSAAPDDREGILDTRDASAPAAWHELLEGLPDGRIEARLEGLGAGGTSATFGTALGCRLRVRVSYLEAGRRRRVRLVWVRG